MYRQSLPGDAATARMDGIWQLNTPWYLHHHLNPRNVETCPPRGEEKGDSMANAILTSLVGMLDKGSLGALAGTLGESEQSVASAMQSSMAAVVGAMASKSEDPKMLRKLLKLSPSTPEGASLSEMAGTISDSSSPWISGGKRI